MQIITLALSELVKMKDLSFILFITFCGLTYAAIEKEQAVTDCVTELSIDEGINMYILFI